MDLPGCEARVLSSKLPVEYVQAHNHYKYFITYVQQLFTMRNFYFTDASSNGTMHVLFSERNIHSRKQYLRKKKQRQKKIDTAVYGFIQVVRSLNKTRISPDQIAKALELPYKEVIESIERLIDQGIKINKIC